MWLLLAAVAAVAGVAFVSIDGGGGSRVSPGCATVRRELKVVRIYSIA
jgi:hypothetical protein